jgi:hypothetical protein
MIWFLSIVLLFLLFVFTIAILNNHLNWKWLCKNAGWHQAPEKMVFDGCSWTGTCPRCGKDVMQDSQGNWY